MYLNLLSLREAIFGNNGNDKRDVRKTMTYCLYEHEEQYTTYWYNSAIMEVCVKDHKS